MDPPVRGWEADWQGLTRDAFSQVEISCFPAPMYASLVESDDGHSLIWARNRETDSSRRFTVIPSSRHSWKSANLHAGSQKMMRSLQDIAPGDVIMRPDVTTAGLADSPA